MRNILRLNRNTDLCYGMENKWRVKNIQTVNIAKKIITVHMITWVMVVPGVENFDAQ